MSLLSGSCSCLGLALLVNQRPRLLSRPPIPYSSFLLGRLPAPSPQSSGSRHTSLGYCPAPGGSLLLPRCCKSFLCETLLEVASFECALLIGPESHRPHKLPPSLKTSIYVHGPGLGHRVTSSDKGGRGSKDLTLATSIREDSKDEGCWEPKYLPQTIKTLEEFKQQSHPGLRQTPRAPAACWLSTALLPSGGRANLGTPAGSELQVT